MLKFLAVIVILVGVGCQFDPLTISPSPPASMADWITIGEICLPIKDKKMHDIQFQVCSESETVIVGSGIIPSHTVPPGAEKMFNFSDDAIEIINRRELTSFSLPIRVTKVEAFGWDKEIYHDGTPYWSKKFRPGPLEGLMYQVKFELSTETLFCEVQILHDFGD